MKRIRIKKEIALVWAVTTNGHEEPLAGRQLSLFLVDPKYRKTEKTFTISNTNEVHFRVLPAEQPYTGVYTLELWENYGAQDQTVVDRRSAFELVQYTPMEDDGTVDDIHAAEVYLGAGNLAVGIHGRGIVKTEKVNADPDDWNYKVYYDDGTFDTIQIARGEKGLTDAEHADLLAQTTAARNAAAYAEQKGNYAKTQGDYAKAQGDALGNASQYAQQALNSKNAAETAEGNARTYAGDADADRIAAQAAKDAAESAKDDAESARDAAQTAKGDAETAAQGVQSSLDQIETNRLDIAEQGGKITTLESKVDGLVGVPEHTESASATIYDDEYHELTQIIPANRTITALNNGVESGGTIYVKSSDGVSTDALSSAQLPKSFPWPIKYLAAPYGEWTVKFTEPEVEGTVEELTQEVGHLDFDMYGGTIELAEGYFNQSGQLVESGINYCDTEYIPIVGGHRIEWYHGGCAESCNIIEYNEDKEVVDYWSALEYKRTIWTNANTKYVRATYLKSNIGSCYLKDATIGVLIHKPYIQGLLAENNNRFGYTDKMTCHIPANGEPDRFVLDLKEGEDAILNVNFNGVTSSSSVAFYVYKSANEREYVGSIYNGIPFSVREKCGSIYTGVIFGFSFYVHSAVEGDMKCTISYDGSINDAIKNIEAHIDKLDVPSYFKDGGYLSTKIDAIRTLMVAANGNFDSFIFCTDQHWPNNQKHSPAIIKHIAEKCALPRLFMGGDYADGLNIDAETAFRKAFGCRVYNAIGNHEYMDYFCEDGVFSVKQITDSTIWANYQSRMTDIVVGDASQNYYYVDNDVQKMRYIILSTFTDGSAGRFTTEQKSWLTNVALNLPNGYTAIIFAHAFFDLIDGAWQPTTIGTEIFGIADAYNGDGSIAALICGHTHYDILSNTDGGIPVFVTTCDKNIADNDETSAWDTYVYSGRTSGTIYEQAFDVFVVDKNNRQVSAVRIGCPANNGDTPSSPVTPSNRLQLREKTY